MYHRVASAAMLPQPGSSDAKKANPNPPVSASSETDPITILKQFKNFPWMRSLDDFARGANLNKSKIKEAMLVFVNNSIPKSLLDLPKDLNKMSIDIHKDLMCYMGDKSAPFPTR